MQLTAVLLGQAGFYENPDGWTYVAVGYGLCVAGIATYAATLLARGRRLARKVPPDERRWLTAGDGDGEGAA
jgi:hypothetical protein